jgi:hypothetical protein
MPMYVRRTQSVQLNKLTDRIAGKLAEHAGSRQIHLRNVRLWITHSENPPAGGGFGKLLRRRANSSDPDAEHWTVVVLHPTQVLVVIDGEKRGTAALSVPLAQASVAAGLGLSAAPNPAIADATGFTITGFPGDQPGSFYIGPGPETAAAECFSAVRSAISAAKNPAG